MRTLILMLVLVAIAAPVQAQRTPTLYDSEGTRIGAIVRADALSLAPGSGDPGFVVVTDDGRLMQVGGTGNVDAATNDVISTMPERYYLTEDCTGDFYFYINTIERFVREMIDGETPALYYIPRDAPQSSVTLGDVRVFNANGCLYVDNPTSLQMVLASPYQVDPASYRMSDIYGFSNGWVEIRLEQPDGIFCSGFECAAPAVTP